MKKISLVFLFFLCSIFLIGCGEGASKVSPLEIGTQGVVDQTKADEAKKLVLAMAEVIEVKGVCLDDDIYIAPQVTQFARLKLESIRKESFEKIKKRYPNANVHVSTDKKIFLELEKLEKKIKNNEISEKKLKSDLKKLEDDMKG